MMFTVDTNEELWYIIYAWRWDIMDDNIVKYIKTGMVNSKCIIVYFKDIADDEYIYITDAILYDESGSNILDSLSKQYNNNTFLSTPVVKNRNWHSISYDVEISNNFIF